MFIVAHYFPKYSKLLSVAKKHAFSLKKLLSLICLFLFVCVFVAIGSTRYLLSAVDPSSTSSERFIISKGESVGSVANKLRNQGFIRSSLAFKLYVRASSLTNKIQAGDHLVSPSQSLPEIAHSLTSGQSDVWITIPEGLRNEEIQEIIESKLGMNRAELAPLMSGKQGFFYPDTYLVPLSATPTELLSYLENNYNSKLAPLRDDIATTSLTEEEVVVLASIIERETLGDEEKPIVAGILLKRMSSGWALETDATIQYIVGTEEEWWPVPTLADRLIPSPYNTYLNSGLPPTPISNPAIASIRSVIFPEHSDYWFYLHDRSGNIHYARTLDEHNDNINKYIR